MSEHLRISIRFLGGEFHGRADNGESEWPPSPLRLFQALTNAAARLDGNQIGPDSAAALRWVEGFTEAPEIYAAKVTATKGYQLYVPDNVADLVAKQWAAGRYFDGDNRPVDISAYRTEKRVRPLRLSGSASVHYVWSLADSGDSAVHRNVLIKMARSISCLGWGVDLVVADAAFEPVGETASIIGEERWIPVESSGGNGLRVPISGTLDDLSRRHGAFLGRIQHQENGRQVFAPVPSLSCYQVTTYRRESELGRAPFAVFSLRKPDDSGFAVFDAKVRRLRLSGMLRHTTSLPDFAASLGWDAERVNSFVLGHDNSDPENPRPTASADRLVFVPLPSIEWRGEKSGHSAGSIRRVLVTLAHDPAGRYDTREFERIVRALEGRELIEEKSEMPAAFLRRQSENDGAIARYFDESEVWTTVTPVVLPGYDDPRQLRRRLNESAVALTVEEKDRTVRKLDLRIERLLRRALRDSGIPESIAADAELDWRGNGYFPGVDLSSRYSSPDQCRRFRRFHVRIAWRQREEDGTLQPLKLKGPFCFGSGRFAGLGLFAPVS